MVITSCVQRKRTQAFSDWPQRWDSLHCSSRRTSDNNSPGEATQSSRSHPKPMWERSPAQPQLVHDIGYLFAILVVVEFQYRILLIMSPKHTSSVEKGMLSPPTKIGGRSSNGRSVTKRRVLTMALVFSPLRGYIHLCSRKKGIFTIFFFGKTTQFFLKNCTSIYFYMS